MGMYAIASEIYRVDVKESRMSRLDTLKDLEVIELETRYEALQAHWEWQAMLEMYGKDSPISQEALGKKHATSDIHKEAFEELDRFKEEIKHG